MENYIPTVLTREWDITNEVELGDRVAVAKKGDIFCCIHANSSENMAARGLQVYHYPGSEVSKKYAELMFYNIKELAETEGYNYDTVWSGVKEANFYVLRETPCPSILIEVGFMSNPDELKWLLSAKGQNLLGYAIADANLEFAGIA
jgi:N-acetylmuramoyl-L-alanine amidase